VGHEVDVTIADLVADKRASTPTKAGVVAVLDMHDVLRDMAHQERRLAGSVRARLSLCREHLRTIRAGAAFKNPLLLVRIREQQVDELAWNLADAMKTVITEAQTLMRSYHEQVARIEPHRLLGRMTVALSELNGRALAAVTRAVGAGQLQLTAQENRLAALNPKSVLKRGYSITMNERTGQVVRAAEDVELNDLLITELGDENLIESRVAEKVKQNARKPLDG
jgi:exodeoxyribonuclease VII large subunit